MSNPSDAQRDATAALNPPNPYATAPAGGAMAPAYAAPPAMTGPLGKVRGTGGCILLTVVTLGFYSLYWYYKTHEEMKEHSGQGIGGGIALILAVFLGFVMPFLTSNEVGDLYARRGRSRPVSAITGLWVILLGWFLFVGAIVWFVKTNGALNAYWRSLGAH